MFASALKFLFTSLFFLTCALQLSSQICINKYTGIELKGASYDTFTKAIVAPNNDIIAIGGLYDYNNPGHITKFSAKGTPLWSYQYALNFFSFYPEIFFKKVYFSDIVATGDGGFLIAGNIDQVLSPFGLPPPVKKYALLVKIDRFGKVLWTKTFSNLYGDLNFSSIYKTKDGDFITYMVTDNGEKKLPGDHSYGQVLRIDNTGKIKWSTLLFTYFFDAGGLGIAHKKAITQGSNTNIIIGDALHKTDPFHNYKIAEGNLHFMELDYATGKLNWESSYEYPVPSNDLYYTPDMANVSELPDGRFSFITTLYLTANSLNTLIKKPVNIITGKTGRIENLVSYTESGTVSGEVMDVSVNSTNGNRNLLIKTGGKSIIADIDATAKIVWQNAYDEKGGLFPANCIASGASGVNIFMSNFQSHQSRLLITGPAGEIDCANVAFNMVAASESLNGPHDSVVTKTDVNFDNYLDNGYPVKRGDDYPIIKNIICQDTLACCTDYADNLHPHIVNLCEGKSYLLPDSTLVKDSGLYDITYKTALGCDSIIFYKVNIDKDVRLLSLGADTCLIVPATIKLTATYGYGKYFWNNSPLATNDTFTIKKPGDYSVTVGNSCGIQTDSITIFDQCEYKVFMPKAFTPNDDGVNDYYRVPPITKNKLIRLRIFDRWGKLVFETANLSGKWDGSYKNEPLSTNAFVYYLEMQSFTGKKLTQRGNFLLLR